MNKKYGENFCDNILLKIDEILVTNFKNEHRRIGDTFILFSQKETDTSIIKNAEFLKTLIVSYEWQSLAPKLYINVTTSVCKYAAPFEDILSWVKRTIEHLKYVKSKNINEVTIAKNLPNKRTSNSFSFWSEEDWS